ncbi:urotensin 1 [Scomber japonicus]|uniref:urotensin 1 n=1 Tax=Scomber japonicus TaxID=13676 RepID=UPI002305C64B|nr:urotensin 1 [Scomber japonicus]
MKSAPLLLLLSSVLLSSHLRPAAGRPRVLPGWLDGDITASQLLNNNILRFLQRREPEPDPDSLQYHQLLLLPDEDEEREVLRTASQLLKRSEEPPLSIDLTFHLLRNMIQMAKMENQREQALLNRRVLDEVGK